MNSPWGDLCRSGAHKRNPLHPLLSVIKWMTLQSPREQSMEYCEVMGKCFQEECFHLEVFLRIKLMVLNGKLSFLLTPSEFFARAPVAIGQKCDQIRQNFSIWATFYPMVLMVMPLWATFLNIGPVLGNFFPMAGHTG